MLIGAIGYASSMLAARDFTGQALLPENAIRKCCYLGEKNWQKLLRTQHGDNLGAMD